MPSCVDERVLKAAAEAEWAALRKQVRRIGIYRTPTFKNATTACVVDMMGGWTAMRDMTFSEMPFRRGDFIELWLDCRGKERDARGRRSRH